MSRYSFIREERYFCSLLMYAIMHNPSLASTLFKIGLDEENFEIYNESSILRDYWNRLGKPNSNVAAKVDKLNKRREAYLSQLCWILGYDFAQITKLDCFRSKNGYVNSPSNYEKKDIVNGQAADLRSLFNMRQDLLIIAGDTLNFFETKIESGNKKEQILSFCLLKKLLDKAENGWAGIKQFKGITRVNLFYIKRTQEPLNVNLPDDMKISIFTWKQIFNEIQKELRTFHGVDIDSILENINF